MELSSVFLAFEKRYESQSPSASTIANIVPNMFVLYSIAIKTFKPILGSWRDQIDQGNFP